MPPRCRPNAAVLVAFVDKGIRYFLFRTPRYLVATLFCNYFSRSASLAQASAVFISWYYLGNSQILRRHTTVLFWLRVWTTPKYFEVVISLVSSDDVRSCLWCFFFRTLLLSSFLKSRDHRCRPFPPPGSCLQFLSRIWFNNLTARRLLIDSC